jgi:hypothetical protein
MVRCVCGFPKTQTWLTLFPLFKNNKNAIYEQMHSEYFVYISIPIHASINSAGVLCLSTFAAGLRVRGLGGASESDNRSTPVPVPGREYTFRIGVDVKGESGRHSLCILALRGFGALSGDGVHCRSLSSNKRRTTSAREIAATTLPRSSSTNVIFCSYATNLSMIFCNVSYIVHVYCVLA